MRPSEEHAGRIVAWVRFDGDEYHAFTWQTEDPGPSTVSSMLERGFLPLVVDVERLPT